MIGTRSNLDHPSKRHTWLDYFVEVLEANSLTTVLDLGCGTGYDALELSRKGFGVTATDISEVAIKHAREEAAREGLDIDYAKHDIAEPLSYPDACFDAVISNLTLHMFPESVVPRVVAEVRRCLVPGGFFMFHVNSTFDIPYRIRLQPPAERLAENFYRLGRGQTMHFFDETACRDLLDGWALHCLEHVEKRAADGQIQKCAWRCVAQRSDPVV